MGRKKQDPSVSVKRLKILAKAGEIFATQGYSNVSMDALANAIPVSKRTLYNHFKDKQSLFSAVMHEGCQKIFQGLEENLQDGRSPEQTLVSIGEHILSVLFESKAIHLLRSVFTEAEHFPELGKFFYESGPKRIYITLGKYLAKLDDKGLLDVPNPKMASASFISMLTGRFIMELLLGIKKHISKKEKKELINYTVKMFLHAHKR
jgi:AcrR family transcriptional regulator